MGPDILELIKKEFEEKEKEEERREAVKALFKDDEEKAQYGFSEKALRYLRRNVKQYRKEL